MIRNRHVLMICLCDCKLERNSVDRLYDDGVFSEEDRLRALERITTRENMLFNVMLDMGVDIDE